MQFFKFLCCSLMLCLLISCGDEEPAGTDPTVTEPDPDETTFNIWSGSSMTFTNPDDADPTLEDNQDRITDNVWLTRDKTGQIFNIKKESSPDKSTSPVDTEWAKGTTASISSLDFKPFRDALGKPKELMDQDLVLRLVTDDIYLDIKFTAWSEGKEKAGFSYTRSTKN